MAFTTTPYCALADVKAALGLATTYTDDDAFLTGLIPQAQSALDRYVGYPFQTDGTPAAPATRKYSGNDSDQLFIDDCQSITSVTEQVPVSSVDIFGRYVNGSPIVRDITADVILGPDNTNPGYLLMRLSLNPFSFGRQNYTVTGVFGQPSVPPDIARACIRLVTHYYKMRDTAYADEVDAVGNIHTKYKKEMPEDVEEILDRYRRRLFLAW